MKTVKKNTKQATKNKSKRIKEKTIRVSPTIPESANRVFKEKNLSIRQRILYDALEISANNGYLGVKIDNLLNEKRAYENTINYFQKELDRVNKELDDIEKILELYNMPNSDAIDNAIKEATSLLRDIQSELDTPGHYGVKKATLTDMYRIADRNNVSLESFIGKLNKDLMKNTFKEYEYYK